MFKLTEIDCHKIFSALDPGLEVLKLQPVPTGKYNSTFKIVTNKINYILRIAPSEDNVFLFYEKNNMFAELQIHKIIKDKTTIKIPEIYQFDSTRSLIPANYIIMEYFDAEPAMTENMYFKVGEILRELHSVTLDEFGYIWENKPMTPQNNWKDAFFIMWNKLVDDISGVGHFNAEEEKWVKNLLLKHESSFNHKPSASLLHMDVWYQNILVDRSNGEIYLIDWDRALAGDVEIEFAVLDYCGVSSAEFWQGYRNIPDFDDKNFQIRRVFYYLYELMKYIVIEEGRRYNTELAKTYKQKAVDILRRI